MEDEKISSDFNDGALPNFISNDINTSPSENKTEDDLIANSILFRRTEEVRIREAWAGWTQVIANVLVPLTLIIAALGLFQQSLNARRDASTNQIALFYSENLSQAQVSLFNLWSGTDLSVLRVPQTRNFINAYVARQISTDENNEKDILASIVILTSYFDRVERCISSDSCDEDTVLTQVGDFGLNFHCIYSGEIDKIRESILVPNLGLGLEAFALRMSGCLNQPQSGN